jgi:hemerythrin-like domain-containing protein
MTGLYDAMREDHRRLDGVFDKLLNRVHVGDVEASREAWTEFEQGLEAHLSAEEVSLLPAFDRSCPDEAAAIRAEHSRIRGLLADMGVSLDLHALREERVAELVETLREHASREEAGLYPWADRELPGSAAAQVRGRLAAAGDALRRVAQRLFQEGPPVV